MVPVANRRLPAEPKFTTPGRGRPEWRISASARVNAIAALTLPTPVYSTGMPARSNTSCASRGNAMTTIQPRSVIGDHVAQRDSVPAQRRDQTQVDQSDQRTHLEAGPLQEFR